MNRAICAAWVAFISGMAVNSIGKPHESLVGLWTFGDAMTIVVAFVFTAIIGFMAGSEASLR